MSLPQTVRAMSGHRAQQIGLATERTANGYYWVRFYAVHDPKTTREAEIIQSLHKGHAASIIKLHESELIFNET
jgi:hypothetical protein